MSVEKLTKRKFLYDGKELRDPGNQYTPSEVKDAWENEYPELINKSFQKLGKLEEKEQKQKVS